jgi:hypothetical protein
MDRIKNILNDKEMIVDDSEVGWRILFITVLVAHLFLVIIIDSLFFDLGLANTF